MNSKVTVFNHPLISHKISILRDINTTTNQFRDLIKEITILMGYEALRDLPTSEVEITTPITTGRFQMLSGGNPVIVPILRAGLGMVDGMLLLVPGAKVGHIGLYRDHETLQPHEYYCKLPFDISQRHTILLDPMLATGGSASAAVDFIKKRGCKNIKFVSVIAAPEGIEKLSGDHPDIQIYCGCVDKCLNEIGYIVPGLGDAGDRIFGTLC